MKNDQPGTGSFPTMGVSAAQLANIAKPIKGRSRPRGNTQGGNVPGVGNKSNRGQVYGRMGASLHPTTKLYEQNAAEATATQRHLVQMPSKSSWTDNWRSAAKSLQPGVNY